MFYIFLLNLNSNENKNQQQLAPNPAQNNETEVASNKNQEITEETKK